MKLSEFWNDDYYNDIIKGCAKTCKKCNELSEYIGKPFSILTDDMKNHFKEIVVNTWERMTFGL